MTQHQNAPESKMEPVSEVWAYCIETPILGGERIAAAPEQLVVPTEYLARHLTPLARQIARETGRRVTLRRFVAVGEGEVVGP